MEPLRIGVLGAARIAELAIVKPASITGDRIVVIAARDRRRRGLRNPSRRSGSLTYYDMVSDRGRGRLQSARELPARAVERHRGGEACAEREAVRE